MNGDDNEHIQDVLMNSDEQYEHDGQMYFRPVL